jgi:hypothetical protein
LKAFGVDGQQLNVQHVAPGQKALGVSRTNGRDGSLLILHGAAILINHEYESPGHSGRNSSVAATGIAGDLTGVAAFVEYYAQNRRH